MCPSGATCLPADCCFSELELYKSNSACWCSTIKLFSPRYCWTIAELALNNNHSFTHNFSEKNCILISSNLKLWHSIATWSIIWPWEFLMKVNPETCVRYLCFYFNRYLMKQVAKVMTGQIVQGTSAYLNTDPHSYNCPLQTLEDCLNVNYLCDIFKNRSNRYT